MAAKRLPGWFNLMVKVTIANFLRLAAKAAGAAGRTLDLEDEPQTRLVEC
jgi:hypothetical protein